MHEQQMLMIGMAARFVSMPRFLILCLGLIITVMIGHARGSDLKNLPKRIPLLQQSTKRVGSTSKSANVRFGAMALTVEEWKRRVALRV